MVVGADHCGHIPAMEEGPSHPIGALYRRHSVNRDITGSAKCPPEKQTSSHLAVETLCMDSS